MVTQRAFDDGNQVKNRGLDEKGPPRSATLLDFYITNTRLVPGGGFLRFRKTPLRLGRCLTSTGISKTGGAFPQPTIWSRRRFLVHLRSATLSPDNRNVILQETIGHSNPGWISLSLNGIGGRGCILLDSEHFIFG